jgi:hypothetical protein
MGIDWDVPITGYSIAVTIQGHDHEDTKHTGAFLRTSRTSCGAGAVPAQ